MYISSGREIPFQPHSISKVLKELDGKSVYINVIAKNFETLEPGIGFRALRVWLRGQYGESYAQRVICTGTQGSHLEELSREHGLRSCRFRRISAEDLRRCHRSACSRWQWRV